jgi:hypothetical protein
VEFAGDVVVYHDEHVVIGTVNHGYTCIELAEVHCAAMALRVTGKGHQRGSRKGEDFGPWFAEPSNNKSSKYSASRFCGDINGKIREVTIALVSAGQGSD